MAEEENQKSTDTSGSSSENIEIPPISKQTAGAATGAVLGSVAGPVGAVVGGGRDVERLERVPGAGGA